MDIHERLKITCIFCLAEDRPVRHFATHKQRGENFEVFACAPCASRYYVNSPNRGDAYRAVYILTANLKYIRTGKGGWVETAEASDSLPLRP